MKQGLLEQFAGLPLEICGVNASAWKIVAYRIIFHSDLYLWQGYGTLLMEEAEQIAHEEQRSTKIAVISGVGTRHYYRKLGYELEGPYMVKSLA